MIRTPEEAIEALVDAFNRRDRGAVEALLDDEIVCTDIPLPPAIGKQAAMDLLEPFLAADEIDWRILAIAVNGPVVLTERLDRFRFAGRGWSDVRACGVFEVTELGLIRAWRDYFDMGELLAAMPPAPSSDENFATAVSKQQPERQS